MGDKTIKKDEKIVLFLVKKSLKRKIEKSIVIPNVTRDRSFYLIYNSLNVWQFEMKY